MTERCGDKFTPEELDKLESRYFQTRDPKEKIELFMLVSPFIWLEEKDISRRGSEAVKSGARDIGDLYQALCCRIEAMGLEAPEPDGYGWIKFLPLLKNQKVLELVFTNPTR